LRAGAAKPSGGAGFVDEVAEIAFGVAAVGVASVCVFFGDDMKKFFDGAAFRGLFVQFELRSQVAQKFCRCHDVRILESGNEWTNRTRGLRDFLRNLARFFSWRECR